MPARTPERRRIRIAHLHSSTGVYGAEQWTATQVKHLSHDLVSPLVITIGTRPGSMLFHEMLVKRGVDAHHLAVGGKLSWRAIVRLRRLLARRRVDILHTHGFKSDILGFLATRGTSIKLVSTPHGWSADEGLRIRLYEFVARVFLRRFDRIYPLSPGLLEDMRARGFDHSKLRLILNAVDISAFEGCFSARTARQPDQPFRVLFVGRLCRPKGVFELAEAFARARFDAPAELYFVGDGPEREALQTCCKQLGIHARVRFVGETSSVKLYLAQSHVLVLPSYSEGIPRAVMEACCAGLTVIGTAIPGIQQVITDRRSGLLVPVRDVRGLAQALEQVAGDPAGAHELAVNAHEHIVAHHSAERQAMEFEHEYQALLGTA